jgi:hypothetical protein
MRVRGSSCSILRPVGGSSCMVRRFSTSAANLFAVATALPGKLELVQQHIRLDKLGSHYSISDLLFIILRSKVVLEKTKHIRTWQAFGRVRFWYALEIIVSLMSAIMMYS